MSEERIGGGKTPDGEWCLDHEWKEYIDPRSGGFKRCMKCGLDIDCEDPDGDLG